MNIDSIHSGIVLDHIKAGRGMDVYRFLHLDELDCPVAYIRNVRSNALGRIADELGITMIDLALGWLNRRPEVTSIIMGFSRLEQLQQNLASIEKTKDIVLPEDELNAVWRNLSGNVYSYHK